MLIPTSKNVKSITDMREDAKGLLNLVEKNGLAYIFYRSQPKAVLLNMDEFVSLQELVEDYLDEQEAEKLSKEPRDKGTSLTEIAKRYV